MCLTYIGFYYDVPLTVNEIFRVLGAGDDQTEEEFKSEVSEYLNDANKVTKNTIKRLMERKGKSEDAQHKVFARVTNYDRSPKVLKLKVENPDSLCADLRKADRVVVVAHSGTKHFMWGSPAVLMDFFTNYKPKACRISLYCCEAGSLEAGVYDDQGVQSVPNDIQLIGWAGDFHRDLCAATHVNYTVSARTGSASSRYKGQNETRVRAKAPMEFYKVVIAQNGIFGKRPGEKQGRKLHLVYPCNCVVKLNYDHQVPLCAECGGSIQD